MSKSKRKDLGWPPDPPTSDEDLERYAKWRGDIMDDYDLGGIVGRLARELLVLRAAARLDAEVCAWADRTFGPVRPGQLGQLSTLARFEIEAAELAYAVRHPIARVPGDVPSEIADARITLARLAKQFNVDVDQAVRDKHAVNLRRAWHQTGDGHGSHCRRHGAPEAECPGCKAGLPLVPPETTSPYQ